MITLRLSPNSAMKNILEAQLNRIGQDFKTEEITENQSFPQYILWKNGKERKKLVGKYDDSTLKEFFAS